MPKEIFTPALAVALTAYTIGVASPGPSNMAIMSAAMSHGRRQAVALAGGVLSGSVMWGLVTALGLSALLQTYSAALVAIKCIGGLYLLFLSWKAVRAAMLPTAPAMGSDNGALSSGRAFTTGLSMHATNPKAMLVWMSIVTLALPPSAGTGHALGVVASCAVVGTVVFLGYALAFSTTAARTLYSKTHRWLNAGLAVVFALAGIGLFLSHDGV